jgi:hypothetical protein
MPSKACECCENTYDKAFEVPIGGTTHVFDSFAVSDRAPDGGAAMP